MLLESSKFYQPGYSQTELRRQFEKERQVPFENGQARYTAIGEPRPDRNRFLIVPGFSGSFPSLQDFAIELSSEGKEQVITVGQPKIEERSEEGVIDAHAKGLLAIIEAEGLQDQPLDIIAHSMGWMTLERAAALAREKGYTCFDVEQGSHSYAVAPAGFVPDENIVKMGRRYLPFLAHDSKANRQHPEGKKIANANAKELITQPGKTAREVGKLVKHKTEFSKLGEVGLKPFVILFGNDIMFPYEGDKGALGKTVEDRVGITDNNTEAELLGAATPVDPNVLTLPSKADFKAHHGELEPPAKSARERLKRALRIRKNAHKSWVDSNNNSGHGDISYHAARLANSIKQIRDTQYAEN